MTPNPRSEAVQRNHPHRLLEFQASLLKSGLYSDDPRKFSIPINPGFTGNPFLALMYVAVLFEEQIAEVTCDCLT